MVERKKDLRLLKM
uniref:Uncharacterized protein n=1 Tax=Arundo donax TaxID=35708 RepID=A0A0A8Y8L5_ARUDO